MNRFLNILGVDIRELAPWEIKRRGYNLAQAWYELREVLPFESDIAGGVILVPVGTVTNCASVPRFAKPVIDDNQPCISLGSFIHDYAYEQKGRLSVRLSSGEFVVRQLSRKQCDAILAFEAMPDLGATVFQQQAVYRALRLAWAWRDKWTS
jgi:hypothetical protein